jgi:predicted RNA-binding Zn ribbon-like protein
MTDETDLLLAFSRTRQDPDAWATPERLERWLADHGVWDRPAPVTPEDIRRVVHVRSAIASLFQENLGGPPDPRTRPTLEAVTSTAPLQIVVADDGGMHLEPRGKGVDRALATIVAAVYQCQGSGSFERLKLCKSCGYAFYDTSKNRSRVWCDMSTCGSQEKARAYRKRHSARG